ncbi:DUF411 domain-containing protein [Natrinema sp. 1APR25-10V2]|uniref:DUF411 domain-containing protein n=1 Tax=Natrinema sp. 1APR25-10V2 TaxID=2951081 RepID=UPI002875E270|nr:DUF411 domain-containing protein [Natrinema sp. 1APR25-10V2]MDS0474631.1 hypothetical protein [Natrinema sp. 1APR25-10V2]
MGAQWTRRRLLSVGGTAGLVGIAGCAGGGDRNRWNIEEPIAVTTVRQYNSPGCSCCEQYASYLRDNVDGTITETVPDDIDAIKREHGVPSDLRSCHTLTVGEYVVEGHVPAEVIATLLGEKPDIDGIALPRMPAGAPGMPGQKESSFVIYALGGGQTGTEFLTL